MSRRPSETLPLNCSGCGNRGTALREAGDQLPYSTSATFFLRQCGVGGVSVQIVCGTCGRVQPLSEIAAAAASVRADRPRLEP